MGVNNKTLDTYGKLCTEVYELSKSHAPEVYNPGGLTLMIDDFCVQSENLWQSVGAKLIEKIKAAAKAKGATQILVVCGAHDHPKRKFLSEQNLQVASIWFVGRVG